MLVEHGTVTPLNSWLKEPENAVFDLWLKTDGYSGEMIRNWGLPP